MATPTWWIKATHLASASEEKCLFPRLSAILPWRCPNPTLPSAGSIQVNKNSYRQMTQSTWCYEDKMPDIPISQQLFARVSLSLGKKIHLYTKQRQLLRNLGEHRSFTEEKIDCAFTSKRVREKCVEGRWRRFQCFREVPHFPVPSVPGSASWKPCLCQTPPTCSEEPDTSSKDSITCFKQLHNVTLCIR